ncbi:hypothetical protein DASC09_010700 [Saccharomycopsis crataegensis]|uniref:Uncharacterized protein n=1 Tax=Saccharomycopsis crataegensis TaxID=43959 RepID=A0AAV5QFM7_9ASCO|nr:hypothetical protein DASC09_010700 [Saccharomycopsis crataegensis]
MKSDDRVMPLGDKLRKVEEVKKKEEASAKGNAKITYPAATTSKNTNNMFLLEMCGISPPKSVLLERISIKQ